MQFDTCIVLNLAPWLLMESNLNFFWGWNDIGLFCIITKCHLSGMASRGYSTIWITKNGCFRRDWSICNGTSSWTESSITIMKKLIMLCSTLYKRCTKKRFFKFSSSRRKTNKPTNKPTNKQTNKQIVGNPARNITSHFLHVRALSILNNLSKYLEHGPVGQLYLLYEWLYY